MVNLESSLKEIKSLVDTDSYFVINKARQYGKTTTLRALYKYLQNEYYVCLMDFQMFGNADFSSEHAFAEAFSHTFTDLFEIKNLRKRMIWKMQLEFWSRIRRCQNSRCGCF